MKIAPGQEFSKLRSHHLCNQYDTGWFGPIPGSESPHLDGVLEEE
jgi:hypothetical protein